MTEKYTIAGQEIEITEGGNIKLHIKSIFKSAGIIYKFPNKCSGISINSQIIDKAKEEKRMLIICIGESQRLYHITPKEIIDIVNKYQSIYKKGDLELFVIPLKALKPISDCK